MSPTNQNVDPFGALIVIALIAVAGFFCVVYVLLPLAIVIAGGGACWGGGHAVVNYVKAFSNNVGRR